MPDYIYSDDSIVVVSKPAGLLSVPGRGEDKQDCLWRRVQQRFPTARIVHRLDQATSGLLILALSAETHRNLSIQFQQRIPTKRYQAIIAGVPQQDSGRIELPLRCDWDNRPRQIVDSIDGKPAITDWSCIETYQDRSRVHLSPITGRSHQLRVHMQAMGHPIVGDQFYACEPFISASDRLLLHAEHLGVRHPISGEWMDFDSSCPF
ncbi:RluA family pseudouridine synthase [Marinobacterium sediminicola]|uniref:Dual-specificity RNA pseudouridine synthase RluA n=1 Tax=Marinobacterium sediminicola TaxID=518898 RepID=A0ABY1RX67_9GAMM|nr:RluA family pseudouridine synthase [Marinobacterium sediminicola]ULG67883.1 RluA family pseudouridine synthase [Marinobacterium sediminicola]SMR71413.1 ribosomal large subunit pseudouridine synthase A [Marinobacterium sediminicola]